MLARLVGCVGCRIGVMTPSCTRRCCFRKCSVIAGSTPARMISGQPTVSSPDVGSERNSMRLNPWRISSNTLTAASSKALPYGVGSNSPGTAVEQADAQGLLQLGNRLGNNGMRDGEPRGRLRHAAGFRHREHDVKVAQPDATADAVSTSPFSTLSLQATGMPKDRTSKLQPVAAIIQLYFNPTPI